MAVFTNRRPDIKAPEGAAKGTGNATMAENLSQSMAWDETSDHGVNASERAQSVVEMQHQRATVGNSLLAGIKTSIVGTAVRKAMAPSFTAEPAFDTAKIMQQDQRLRLLGYTQEELEYVGEATSPEEYQYLNEQVLNHRAMDGQISDNPVTGIAGQLVGDAPFVLLPMGAAGIAGKTGMAIRTGYRVGEMAVTYYANSELGQPDWVMAVAGGIIGVDQLFDVRRAVVGLSKAETVAGYAAKNEAVAKAAKDDIFSTETGFGKRAEASGVKSDSPEILPDEVSAKAGRGIDPDAPTVGAAETVAEVPTTVTLVVGKNETSYISKKLSKPVTVASNSNARVEVTVGGLIEHLRSRSSGLSDGARELLNHLPQSISDVPVSLSANPRTRSSFSYGSSGDRLLLRTEADEGTVFKTAQDALSAVSGDIAVHELIHAASSRVLRAVERGWQGDEATMAAVAELDSIRSALKGKLPNQTQYPLKNTREFVAELANNQKFVETLAKTPWQQGKTMLTKAVESILKALGFKGTDTALARSVQHLETLMQKQVQQADSINTFLSGGLRDAFDNANIAGASTPLERARRLEKGVRSALKQSFALYDNLAAGSKELADLLVSDATKVGERASSVVDHKRNLTIEQNLRAAKVEDAFVAAMRQDGVGAFDMFFSRAKALESRQRLEHEVSVYLDSAYTAELAGRAVPDAPAEIADIVDAYRKSGWAESWHEHVKASGLMKDGAMFEKSANYAPRRYSAAKFSQFEPKAVQNLLREALKDLYPSMDKDVLKRVSKTWYDRTVSGPRSKDRGGQWKNLLQGMDNDELFMAMREAGIDDATIKQFMGVNVPSTGATGQAKNLRKRLRLNVSKEFVVNESTGETLRLLDVMDTRLMQNMHGYTNSMSGRVAFARRGINDLSVVEKQIQSVTADMLKRGEDSTKWARAVDDAIDHILGFPVGTDIPELMRGASNVANTVMLKNSGLYQLTDMSIAMKEFGMARTLRAMAGTGLLRKADAVVKDSSTRERLHSILNGGYQNEARYRHIQTYCEDNLDLTMTSQIMQTTQNMAQAARLVNGFSMVHRMMANLNSGMLVDEVEQMLKGGSSRILKEHGLTDEMAQKMQAAYAKDSTGLLPRELQQELELVSTRAMDLVMQNIRTGETSHFAQFSPVGKLVIGYQSFAIAATNKLLRRHLANGDYAGLALLMTYQYPLMLLATHAKLAMDGKEAKSPYELTMSAAMNMSAIGGVSLLSPLFLGESPRHSLTSLGYITQSIGAVQETLEDGRLDTQRMSKVLPFAQEFMPLRAVINNMGE